MNAIERYRIRTFPDSLMELNEVFCMLDELNPTLEAYVFTLVGMSEVG